VAIGIGAQANNPWLLELPDPITKATWDNYAVVSPKFAKDTWGLDLSVPGTMTAGGSNSYYLSLP